MAFLSILFSFRGRMGRAEYAVVLTAALVLMVGGIFVIAATAVTFLAPAYLATGAIIVWTAITVWAIFAAHFKRYHDIGGRESLRARLAFAPVIGLFVLLFIPGAAGSNQIGPPREFFARLS